MDDLKLIKKYYGEKMSHLCRELFPTLLETPGLLYETFSKAFYPNRFLYDDIVESKQEDEFKTYIYNIVDIKREKAKRPQGTPAELLEQAGYILYECHSEEEIQRFRKYYKDDEKLCTFNGGRLDRCYVFFAVKKNVDEIKRENFKNPERQDEYGTSVISIQFSRGNNNTLSIKNRYNHTVLNPDATFGNNLDNIIPGLTAAFEETYDLDIVGKNTILTLDNYTRANDGRLYRFLVERENVYYCSDNILIDNHQVVPYDKSRYLIIEGYIVDFKDKRIYCAYADSDEFLESIYTKSEIESIRVEKDEKTNRKNIIINEDIIIGVSPDGTLKSYKNPHLTKLENRFLRDNEKMEELDLPNVEEIGTETLRGNNRLKKLNLPKCKKIGTSFLNRGGQLTELDLPELEEVNSIFCSGNTSIERVNLPKVRRISNDFLYWNRELREISLPNVEYIGSGFLSTNQNLRKIELPNCKKIGNDFLPNNVNLAELDLPNVEKIGDYFLRNNDKLKRINLPMCKQIGTYFLMNLNCYDMKEIDLPELETINSSFMVNARALEKINLPKLVNTGDYFLYENNAITELNLPNVGLIGESSLEDNNSIKILNIPNCKTIGKDFLKTNKVLESITLPSETFRDNMNHSQGVAKLVATNDNLKVITDSKNGLPEYTENELRELKNKAK